MSDQRRKAWILLAGMELAAIAASAPFLGVGAALVLALFLLGLFGSVLSWRMCERSK